MFGKMRESMSEQKEKNREYEEKMRAISPEYISKSFSTGMFGGKGRLQIDEVYNEIVKYAHSNYLIIKHIGKATDVPGTGVAIPVIFEKVKE